MSLAALILTIFMAKLSVTSVEATFPDLVPYHLDCYPERELEGEIIPVWDNIRDLKNHYHGHNFSDIISSCTVTGIWLLYGLPGFQGKLNAVSGENKPFTPLLQNSISSILKIGSEDTLSNELVMFPETRFQKGNAKTFSQEQDNFPDGTVVKSAIVTGFSDWTVVSNTLLTICLKANKNGAAFFSEIDIRGFGTVKSIYQGCKGKILLGEVQILEQGGNATQHNKCVCSVGYQGNDCKTCSDGFYKVGEECRNCDCDLEGTGGSTTCDSNGNCRCISEFTGRRCDECMVGCYRNGSTCRVCSCNHYGVLNGYTGCDSDGKCRCDNNKYFTGDKCRECIHGFYKINYLCQNCQCFVHGVKDNDTSCSSEGNCTCDHIRGYTGKKCDQCLDGYYPGGFKCNECQCNIHGVLGNDTTCGFEGRCNCDHDNGYAGPKCEMCLNKYYKKGDKCESCNCNGKRENGNCKAKGACECIKGYGGVKCEKCCPGYYKKNGECKECDCKKPGMTGFCQKHGKCICRVGHQGGHCQYCSYGYNKHGDICCPIFGHCFKPNQMPNDGNFRCI